MLKRSFDVVVSAMLLLLLSPAMLLIAILIKMTSEGPVIFRQERIGLNNVPFTILKFRTMEDGSERSSETVTTNGDKRITKVGRLLRPTHLDELPQLINVLRGEMSLVGPRPCPIRVACLRCEKIPDFNRRHGVKPGLTGPAQILGRALTESEMERAVSLDLAYVRRRSLLGDISIIIRTIPAVLRRQGI